MPPTSYLDAILRSHRLNAAADDRDLEALAAEAAGAPAPRPFTESLRREGCGGLPAVIAEVKRYSPSKGPIAPDLDPASVAREYEAGGAACLSVLTDQEFFAGSPADLVVARAACGLPVLRKDFTVSAADVFDARIMGADAVLLIAAALDDAELAALRTLAGELEMAALVEIHDEDELARAVDAGAELVGVNQRDLFTFEVDTERAVRLVSRIPDGVLAVAESGIAGPTDVHVLGDAGYTAILVGESLLRAPDKRRAVESLARRAGSAAGRA